MGQKLRDFSFGGWEVGHPTGFVFLQGRLGYRRNFDPESL